MFLLLKRENPHGYWDRGELKSRKNEKSARTRAEWTGWGLDEASLARTDDLNRHGSRSSENFHIRDAEVSAQIRSTITRRDLVKQGNSNAQPSSDYHTMQAKRQRSLSPIYHIGDEDGQYEPYVPIAQRREQKLARLVSRRSYGSKAIKQFECEDAEREEERHKEKVRRERTLLVEAQEVHSKKAAEDAKKTEGEKAEEADAKILAAVAHRRKLASDLELAKGIQYTESLKTSWRPPKYIRDRNEEEHQKLRQKYHILVDGDDVPPPIEHFAVCLIDLPSPQFAYPRQDMKLPEALLEFLTANRIVTPTPIQLQGIPTALVSEISCSLVTNVFFRFSGRDMIGIAFTGSGKTLAFCLPLIMMALEEETKLPFIRGEGPVGVILCPSRELATQTFENVLTWCNALAKSTRHPQLNTLLCIGGIPMNDQSHVMSKGLHIVVATPGRLIDMLEKKKFAFDNCKYLCMDEADRMIDLGFEDDVRNIMSFFKVRNLSSLSIVSRGHPATLVAPAPNPFVFRHDA